MDCNHTIKTGKFAGRKCKNTAHHDGYCWKHKKVQVPKEVAEAVGMAPEKPVVKPKYKFSAFRWTVNSNTSATKMTPEDVGEFKRLIGFIFSAENVAEYLEDRTAPDPKTNLDDVQVEYHFEIAPTTHAVHAHGVIKLKHHGNYQISMDAIREIIAGVLGKRIHFNVSASGNADLAWEQYVRKNQSADKI